MNDITPPQDSQTKTLRAKSVTRKAAKIASGTDKTKLSKRRGQLAIQILRQISNGDIQNPKAVARAFFKGARQDTETPI